MRFRTGKRHHRLAAWLVAGGLVLAPAALAAEKAGAEKPAADKPAMDPEMQKQMEAWAKLAHPGPQHAELMKWAGKWKAVTKSWMTPGEPTVTEGTTTCAPLLGGRYIREEFKGTFMEGPFEGFSITGYDNQHQEYVSMWVDSMGTGMLISKGQMDPSGKVLTMTAEYDDPMTGQKSPMRMVTRHVDDNTKIFEMYGMHDGKEAKEMEITYTRQK